MRHTVGADGVLFRAFIRSESGTDLLRSVLQFLRTRAQSPTPLLWVTRTRRGAPRTASFVLDAAGQWHLRPLGGSAWPEPVSRSLSAKNEPTIGFALEGDDNGWFVLSDTAIALSPAEEHDCRAALNFALRVADNVRGSDHVDRTLRELRHQLTAVDLPQLGLMSFADLFQRAASAFEEAFPRRLRCMVGLSVHGWRNQWAASAVTDGSVGWYADDGLDDGRRRDVLAAVLAAVAGNRGSVECTSEVTETALRRTHPLGRLLGGAVRIVTLAIYEPTHRSPFGLPFIAAITGGSDSEPMPERERVTLRHYFLELRDLFRARDLAEHAEKGEELEKQIQTIRDPVDAARAVVDYLADRYAATEVAVLERHGNFLSPLAARHVKFKDIPTIYIPTRTGLVSLVAEKNVSRYDYDVSQQKEYLPVVKQTRTQYTLPLTWRATNLGVMLVGLGVVDGLSPHDRDSIDALATKCAESLSALRHEAERRAVLHALKDNLPIVREQISIAQTSQDVDRTSVLDSASRLVSQCLGFVADYAQTEPVEKDSAVSLAAIVRRAVDDEALRVWLKPRGVPLTLKLAPDLQVMANEKALSVAIRHVVMNGIEAIVERRERRPKGRARGAGTSGAGLITIRLRREDVRYGSLKKPAVFGVVEIRDNGVGIPKEHQDKVFEFGYSSKDHSSHLGGGLSVARRAVESFGGRIRFVSNEKGTTFHLYVPTRMS